MYPHIHLVSGVVSFLPATVSFSTSYTLESRLIPGLFRDTVKDIVASTTCYHSFATLLLHCDSIFETYYA